MSGRPHVAAVVLTGTAGSGKTATAVAIGEQLQTRGQPAVVADLDWFGWTYLGPGSPSPDEMIAKNLAAIWPNFVAAGMRYAVMARGLISQASLRSLKESVPEADLRVVRLTAAWHTIEARLRSRDIGTELDQHLREGAQMAQVMERLQLEDFVVSSDSAAVESVAAEIIRRLGWSPSAPG